MLVALAPIAIRYLDRQTVTRIAVVSDDAGLRQRAAAVADSCSTSRPPAPTRRPGRSRSGVELIADRGRRRDAAMDGGRPGRDHGRPAAAERPGRRRLPDQRGRRTAQRSQLLSIAAFGDRRPRLELAGLPPATQRRPVHHARLPRRVDQHGDRGRAAARPAAGGQSRRCSASSSSSSCSSPSSSTGCGSRPASRPRRAAG